MPAAEVVLTMAPPPVFSIEITPYFMPKNTPRRFTEWTRSQLSAVCSWRGAMLPPKPALLTKDVEAAELLLGGGDHARGRSASSATSACTRDGGSPEGGRDRRSAGR